MAITAETARELQRRSVQKRQQNVQLLRQQVKELENRPPEIIVVASSPGSNSTEPFQVETLSVTRAQMRLVQKRIEEAAEAGDSKGCKEWTDALSRLAELERQLAGRPMPGSLKPTAPKRRAVDIAPQAAEQISQVIEQKSQVPIVLPADVKQPDPLG